MENPTDYFQDSKGNKSSSRIKSFIVVIAGLVMAEQVLIFGTFFNENPNMILLASAAGTIFVTIAGPAMYYMYNQKKTEEGVK